MSEQEKETLDKFCEVVKSLNDTERERLMSFVEGFLYAKTKGAENAKN